MSKRKGLSTEEKRTRMLEIFHEKTEAYTMKELEKLGPQKKGVIAQSVKDIVKSLVDDELADTAKIGKNTLFWSVPNKEEVELNNRLEKLKTKLASMQKLDGSLSKQISEMDVKETTEDTTERMKLLEEVGVLEPEVAKMQNDYKFVMENSPEAIAQLEREIEVAKASANRWADNIDSVLDWCKNKFGMEREVLEERFNISEMDYLA